MRKFPPVLATIILVVLLATTVSGSSFHKRGTVYGSPFHKRGTVSGSPFQKRGTVVISPSPDASTVASCDSLKSSCSQELSNLFSSASCVLYVVCSQYRADPSDVISGLGAPATQPRLSQSAFDSISGGQSYISQSAYISAFYAAAGKSGGGYPDNVEDVIAQWQGVLAWTGDCSSGNIAYKNFADWLEYSSTPGVCPAVTSCNAADAAASPCVPSSGNTNGTTTGNTNGTTTGGGSDNGDNGSCNQMKSLCFAAIPSSARTTALYQYESCVLATLCYAETTPTDGILLPYDTEEPLSESVFYGMTGGASTMSQQNAIDAYYAALSPSGPFPSSPDFVITFWSMVSAWSNSCDTKEVSYEKLADYIRDGPPSDRESTTSTC
ncbi:hypothetical protein BV22DRAFT_1133236 [Leucogyrophana mollusca]|uniref:Uncharacterized protein n=1 Tax=Leucogyrophana mollusca TaxID=85980 RepID=A0ACB8B3U1_9AGAM|nr:hypothetical protein BV22DRAFT_1133236 [Leucogyrophana mollusca]